MDATLTINSGPNATTAYLGWSPVSARLALSNVPAGGATVTLRNRKPGSGGQVCFKLDRQPPFDTTLTLHVANDHAVDLFVAGQFQHPSTSNRDASSGSSSMFTRATVTCSASCSRIGSIARQGLHHGAQKSTTTGAPETASSNVRWSRSSTNVSVALLEPPG